MRNCERVICEKRMQNQRAKLGKLRNAKCETAVYMNEQQTEDMKDRTTILVAQFLFFALHSWPYRLQFIPYLIYPY